MTVAVQPLLTGEGLHGNVWRAHLACGRATETTTCTGALVAPVLMAGYRSGKQTGPSRPNANAVDSGADTTGLHSIGVGAQRLTLCVGGPQQRGSADA